MASYAQDSTYLSLSSQSENATAVDTANPNADFLVSYTSPVQLSGACDIALSSITLNVGAAAGKDASNILDTYVLCSLVSPQTRVGDTKVGSLRRIECNQKNERQRFDFEQLQWVRCNSQTISQIHIRVATDTFQRVAGAPVALHTIHPPTADNAVCIQLALRPSRRTVADGVGVTGRY